MGEFESHSPIELRIIFFVNNRQISRTQRTSEDALTIINKSMAPVGLKCQSRV